MYALCSILSNTNLLIIQIVTDNLFQSLSILFNLLISFFFGFTSNFVRNNKYSQKIKQNIDRYIKKLFSNQYDKNHKLKWDTVYGYVSCSGIINHKSIFRWHLICNFPNLKVLDMLEYQIIDHDWLWFHEFCWFLTIQSIE